MTDAELFDDGIKDEGGEIRPEDHVSGDFWRRLRLVADHTISLVRSYYPRLPEIYFGFIDNSDINAVAFKHRESDDAPWRYFIGVYTGAVYAFQRAFSQMLCGRRFFPDIGDVSKESEQPALPTDSVPSAGEALRAGLLPKPQCPIRWSYCEKLLEVVFRFLMLHEIAHVLNGHIELLNTQMRSSFLFERSHQDRSTEEKNLFFQTLEVDADAFATQWVMMNARGDLTENQCDEIVKRLHAFAFAMLSFFRIFGDSRVLGKELEDDHPPDRTRHVLCMMWSQVEIHRWGFENVRLIGTLVTAMGTVEGAFAVLKGEAPSITGYQEAQGPQGKAYAMAVVNHLNAAIKPLLKNLAFHDLYKQSATR